MSIPQDKIKRIPDLPKYGNGGLSFENETSDAEKMAVYDPTDDTTKQVENKQLLNTKDWEAITYHKDPSLVFDPADKSKIYRLNTYDNSLGGQVAVPFTSSDFATELAADKWKPVGPEFGALDSVKFNPNYNPVSSEEAEFWWNGKFHTIKMDTGLGDYIINLGQDQFYVFYNDTGVDIDPFRVLHLKSATLFDSELYPTFELADPREWEKVQGTLAVTCCTVGDGELGIAVRSAQKLKGGDTSTIAAGSQLWLAADGTGSFTATKPAFPDYALSIGGNYNQQAAPDGEILVSFTGSIEDDFHNTQDGAIRESFNFTTSSDGATVTGLLENVTNTRNLTCFFSDVGKFTLDTTTSPLTITLTPGTDANIQKNYVYVPKSTKVLTVSTSGWPITEHCRVAEVDLQSALTTQDDGGVLGNQNTNDHIKKEEDNGHVLHLAAWIRKQFATFESGTEATFDNTGGNGYIQITSGIVNQLHEQAVGSFSMVGGDQIRAWNDFSGNRPKISNLSAITAYSDGSVWNNDWGKIVVWRVANKSGEYSPVMFNLPSGGYNSEANALADLDSKADYSISNELKTKAVLIGAFTFRISGGVITYNIGYEDLRGQLPITVAGGGTGGTGGVTTFLALTDTPSTYVSQAGRLLRVNAGETGVEFYDASIPTEKSAATYIITVDQVMIDWDSHNHFIANNRLAVALAVDINYLNVTEARMATFKVEITNLATLTFPVGTVSSDKNWTDSTRVWSPPDNGKYSISIYKTPLPSDEYEVLFTQEGAL